jgi:UDP-glucuronate decarboxylase
MRIIVTGGAGFLGSNLCGKLLDQGHEVLCLDNLLTGSRENIAELEKNPKFKFMNLDVSRFFPEDLFLADRIYHLASPASPNLNSSKSYHAHPFETMAVNTSGTLHLCNLAMHRNARILFASTSEAYGDPLEHPQKESYRGNVSTTGPRAVYDEAKRFGETIVSAYVRSRGVDGRIIRIFNTYGPGMALDDGRVVIEFVKAALENNPFPIFGDGTQTRSFCYVDDLVEGIMLAMEKGEKGEIYNIGNPNEFTILDLAHKVKELVGSSSDIVSKEPLPEDDPLKRCPDITKAKEKLGWEPKIQLEEGLKKLIEHVKSVTP